MELNLLEQRVPLTWLNHEPLFPFGKDRRGREVAFNVRKRGRREEDNLPLVNNHRGGEKEKGRERVCSVCCRERELQRGLAAWHKAGKGICQAELLATNALTKNQIQSLQIEHLCLNIRHTNTPLQATCFCIFPIA